MNSVLLWRRRESDKEVSPGKHGEFVDKDTNDLHLKLIIIIGGNMSDSN